ncbi:uncharacterized protein LOC127800666 isoform X2 [Diospyros lotus]|uniref:uncharacterized protein LOC127800666 isoform X2 n=1 Tax=Diospyros lotus TaxID=55363 RepID=UPI00225A5CEF|nr:uncharacterized protein LOC127800666 isoform X2 [Diospyros lotus]
MWTNQPEFDSFRLFSSSSSEDETQSGLGFLDSSLQQQHSGRPPRPPCLEVLPSEVSSSVRYTVEPVNLNGITLVKLGCGHGLPGIFTGLEGAAVVHFQDFNAEVLRCLTLRNVNANLLKKSESLDTETKVWNTDTEFRFFAGDWCEVHQILPCLQTNAMGQNCNSWLYQSVGYDIILMAETVYSTSSLPHLYQLIKKCLNPPHGVVYMAAKKHYFGVGGGSRRFLSMVEKDSAMVASLVAEVADGSSNVREVWKLHLK